MRSTGGRIVWAMAFWLVGAAVVPVGAQEAEEEREEIRGGVEEAREEAREAMADARNAMRQAREQVREVHFEVASRALLGVGIDYDQGARWDSLGVLVTRVPDDGPAADAGLREGDVLVAVDGQRLTAPLGDDEEELDDDFSLPVQRLVRAVRRHDPGEEMEVTYVRDGEEATTTVELASQLRMRSFRGPDAPRPPRAFRFRHDGPPALPRLREGRPGFGEELRHELRRELAPLRWMDACGELEGGIMAGPCVAGLRVARLNPELGAYFGTDEGVLVTEAAEDSSLDIRPGDVILGVGGRTVDEPDDLRRILRSYEEDEEVRLRIRRDGRELEVTGTAP